MVEEGLERLTAEEGGLCGQAESGGHGRRHRQPAPGADGDQREARAADDHGEPDQDQGERGLVGGRDDGDQGGQGDRDGGARDPDRQRK